jgi:hypothetical protein
MVRNYNIEAMVLGGILYFPKSRLIDFKAVKLDYAGWWKPIPSKKWDVRRKVVKDAFPKKATAGLSYE